MSNEIMDLQKLVDKGQLFYPLGSDTRVEAFIPTIGHSNHSSNLLFLKNGDLFCCWMAGSFEGNPGMNIVGSILRSDSNGWGPCFSIAADSTHSLQNPVPYQDEDGKLFVLYTAQECRGCSEEEWKEKLDRNKVTGNFTMQHTSQILYCASEDNGKSWSDSNILFSRKGSFIRHKIVHLTTGELLLPMYYSSDTKDYNNRYGNDYSVVRITKSFEEEWTEYEIPGSKGLVHASIVLGEDKRCFAFFRSRSADRIYKSASTDNGRSWSIPERIALPNNNASISAIRLQSGRIAMIYNHYSANDDVNKVVWPKQRYPLTIALSENNGLSWPYKRHLEAGDGFFEPENDHLNKTYSYPIILQDEDGNIIHCSYSYASRHCIKYVRISEKWILGEEV